jgi:hypothetical protein
VQLRCLPSVGGGRACRPNGPDHAGAGCVRRSARQRVDVAAAIGEAATYSSQARQTDGGDQGRSTAQRVILFVLAMWRAATWF